MPNTPRTRIRAIAVLLTTLALLIPAIDVGTAAAQPRRGQPHLRWGVEGGAGGAWGRPQGPAIGLYGQLGLQLDPMFAIFYQPSLIAHALGTHDDAETFFAIGNLAMVDVTVGILQLGFGGGFDAGRFARCDNAGCVSGERRIDPAIGGRVALLLQLRDSPALGRLGIPFGFQIHTTFLEPNDRLTALMLTIGIERY